MPNRFKFKLGDIVTTPNGQRHIAVQRRMMQRTSSYRLIPCDTMGRAIGVAKWYQTYLLQPTGEHTTVGILKRYRANEQLEKELGGRGCRCMCCVHEALDPQDFSNKGRWLPDNELE